MSPIAALVDFSTPQKPAWSLSLMDKRALRASGVSVTLLCISVCMRLCVKMHRCVCERVRGCMNMCEYTCESVCEREYVCESVCACVSIHVSECVRGCMSFCMCKKVKGPPQLLTSLLRCLPLRQGLELHQVSRLAGHGAPGSLLPPTSTLSELGQ